MLNCVDINKNTSVNYYDSNIICYSSMHIAFLVVGIIFASIFSFICYMAMLSFYDFKLKTTSPLARTSIEFDRQILLVKVLFSLAFNLLSEDDRWIACAFLLLVTSLMFYSFYNRQPHLNPTVHFFYFFMVSVLQWSSIVVVINNIFANTAYNGGIALFILGIPAIIGILIYFPIDYISLLLPHVIKFTNGDSVLQQIRRFLFLYNEIEHSRKSQILLKGYAFQFETQCSIQGCPLKKYIESIQKGKEIPSFFLQHAEMLFLNGISKFPFCISLRLAYSFFLLEYLNKKRKANEELMNIERFTLNNEQQFVVFHFHKLIEEHMFDLIEDETKIDAMSNLAYKNSFYQFKQAIARVTNHYINFWSLLLNQGQVQDELKTLSDYGTKIIIETEEIQKLFDKLQKINSRDVEVIYYYSDFLYDIVNKSKEANEYKAKLKDIEDTKNYVDDSIFFSLDINTLSSSDEYQFIALSGLRESFGIITHISLGVCLLLGYAKNELIGKHYELIMPEIFIKRHQQILSDKVNEFKKETVNSSFDDQKYNPEFKSISSFAKTKARYLVKIEIKVALIVTETQSIAFIAKMNKDVNALISDKSVCSILTNNNFIIQNFTVNAVNMLGINSKSMNNSVEITRLLKQFHEEYLKSVLDNEDMTPEQKLATKRQIINKKFRTSTPVNWKQYDFNDYQTSNKTKDSILQNSINISKYALPESRLTLSVKDAIIGGIQEGYIFEFMKCKQSLMSNNNFNVQSIETPNNFSVSPNGSHSVAPSFPDYLSMKTFIPNNKTDFQLNPKNLSYVRDPQFVNNFREEIKEKAIKKIQSQNEANQKRVKKEKKNDEDCLSSIEESENNISRSSYSSNDDFSSKESSNKEDNLENNNSNRNNFKKNTAGYFNNSNQDYYKVSFSNIKYSIYSYEKKTVLEVANFIKKSQVEMKFSDDKELVPLETKKSSQTENIKEVTKKEGDSEKILINQIEYALVNGDSQPTVTRLKWVCSAIILYLISFGIGWLVLLLFTGDQLREGSYLVQNNYKLIFIALLNHISIRELTLRDQRNYNPFVIQGEDNSKEALLTLINDRYNESHRLNLKLITSKFPLSDKAIILIFNHTIPISGIKEDLTLSNFNLSLSASFFEINTGTFHILQLKHHYPTNNYIFFFLYNVNNNISIYLQKQISIYMSEVFSLMDSIIVYFSLLISFGFALALGSYFLFAFAYNSVARRKESYLEMFFEISSHVIKCFLDKCELFTKKLQLDSFSDFINTDDNELEDNMNSTTLQSASNKSNQNPKRKVNSKETALIKILYLVFIFGIILMLGLTFGYYLNTIDTLGIYLRGYQSLNDVFIEYEKLYKAFNEYYFDANVIVEHERIEDYFPKLMINFYVTVEGKKKYFNNYRDQLPEEFVQIYKDINRDKLCELLNITEVICRNEILINLVDYGFNGMLNFFIEEIRIMKTEKINRDREREETVDYKYNLTLNGNKENDKLIDKTNEDRYFEYSPILMYNFRTIKRIKVIFDHFITPGFLFLNEKFIECYSNYMKMKELTYILICSLYLAIVICLYLFIWKPYEHELYNLILKTKSMLLIIPKDVLVSLANIDKLLNVNLIFNKNKSVKE